jgi:hypothetical protein
MHNHYNFYFPPYYNFNSANEYLPFEFTPGKSYILSFWANNNSTTPNTTNYSFSSGAGVNIDGTVTAPARTSNLIEGWQQFEVAFTVPVSAINASIVLPGSFYIDDIRVFPKNSNMKSFVYNPVNEKLMATLDENNFATLYEYDQEGLLVRTKKETERGILTVSESRSNNPKAPF